MRSKLEKSTPRWWRPCWSRSRSCGWCCSTAACTSTASTPPGTVQYSTVQYSTVQYRFYSSSLLIIYEGQPEPGHKETGYEEDSMDCEQFEDARAVAGDTKVAGQVEIFTGYHPVAKIYSWLKLVW